MFDWTHYRCNALAGQRVVWVGDGTYNYFAALPADTSVETATEDFVRGYEFPDDTGDIDAARRELRDTIEAGVIEAYNPDLSIAEQR